MVGPVGYGIGAGLASVLKTGIPNAITAHQTRVRDNEEKARKKRDAERWYRLMQIYADGEQNAGAPPMPGTAVSTPTPTDAPMPGTGLGVQPGVSTGLRQPTGPSSSPIAAPNQTAPAGDSMMGIVGEFEDPETQRQAAQLVAKLRIEQRTSARTGRETATARTGLRTALAGETPDYAGAAEYATQLPNGAAILNALLDFRSTQATNTAKTVENQRKLEAGTTLARRLGEIGNRPLTAAEYNELNPLSLLSTEKPLVDYGREIAESNALIGQRQRERPVATPEEAQRAAAIRQFQQSVRIGMPTYDKKGMVTSRRRMTDVEIDELLAQLALSREDVGLPSGPPPLPPPSVPNWTGAASGGVNMRGSWGPQNAAPLTPEQQGAVTSILARKPNVEAVRARRAQTTDPDLQRVLDAVISQLGG